MKNKCSLKPQSVIKDVWYYESPTVIEVHLSRGNLQTVVFISCRELEASLKRMNASRIKSKS